MSILTKSKKVRKYTAADIAQIIARYEFLAKHVDTMDLRFDDNTTELLICEGHRKTFGTLVDEAMNLGTAAPFVEVPED